MTDICGPGEASTATVERMPRVSSTWLGLREATDAAARSTDLVALVRRLVAGLPRLVIHDLGCGTGSMGRWLAPLLSGPQHWIMYDHDADLLEQASAEMVDRAADGASVTAETRQCDITRLTADDLDGAGLVTAAALLDLLTVEVVERVATALVGTGCPALLTISVVGRVALVPADPLDARITSAFNAHQRRNIGGRRLLGPDAVDAMVDAFIRRGGATVVCPSPWVLGTDNAKLLSEWFAGWVAAACEQQPELAGPAAGYVRRRLAEIAESRLGAVVCHIDLVAHRKRIPHPRRSSYAR